MSERTRRVAIVTGTRAEFGLLLPVMRAVDAHPALELKVVAAGAHLLEPARTIDEVRRHVTVDAEIPMQGPGAHTRPGDARATGRGITGFADAFASIEPGWVVVLGDRIEAFAAASAASIGGWALAHIHGGDRAEGVADEAMRHAVTKLAHLHLPATRQSASRIIAMGEPADRVVMIGSPAIDGLDQVEPMTNDEAHELGDPQVLVLHHPAGLGAERERTLTRRLIEVVGGQRPVLCLNPNHDPGRDAVLAELDTAAHDMGWTRRAHLPRPAFLALLKRIAANNGFIAGNSSSALIEASALGVRAIDLGPRQAGRERPASVLHLDEHDKATPKAVRDQLASLPADQPHPYGPGQAGPRTASVLAGDPPHQGLDPRSPDFMRKRNTR